MRFIEETEAAWSAEQLAAAEREIEEQKREWEENRLAAMREEQERRAREMEEEADILTYSREDATNQVSAKSKKISGKLNSSGKKVRRVVRNAKSKADKNGEAEVTVVKKPKTNRMSLRKSNAKNEEIEVLDDNTQMSMSSDVDVVKVNGDSNDSNSKWSCTSEEIDIQNSESSDSDSLTSIPKHVLEPNRVDHNSPRTRSRGTVEINLWTLDVSPILPGVKPVKVCTASSPVPKKNDTSEEEVNEHKVKVRKKRIGPDNIIASQTNNVKRQRMRNELVENKKRMFKKRGWKNAKTKVVDDRKLNSSEIVLTADGKVEVNSDQSVVENECDTDVPAHVEDEDSIENHTNSNELNDKPFRNKMKRDLDKKFQDALEVCKHTICKVVVRDVLATGEISKYLHKNDDSEENGELNGKDVTEDDLKENSVEHTEAHTKNLGNCLSRSPSPSAVNCNNHDEIRTSVDVVKDDELV